MKFKLNKIIAGVALMACTLNANAVDTYDLNSNILTIPYVIVDGANYAVTLQNQGDFVFKLAEVAAASDTSDTPDTFDIATGVLSIPQVIVGSDSYKVEMQLQAGGDYIFHLASAEVITPATTPEPTPEPTPVATPTPEPTPDPAIARGQTVYDQQCASCHSASPKTHFGRIMAGIDWQVSRNAITNNIGGMSFLTTSDAELQDVAAYLGSL